MEGRFVTRIIYLEDPKLALPVATDKDHQEWFEVGPHEDPLGGGRSVGPADGDFADRRPRARRFRAAGRRSSCTTPLPCSCSPDINANEGLATADSRETRTNALSAGDCGCATAHSSAVARLPERRSTQSPVADPDGRCRAAMPADFGRLPTGPKFAAGVPKSPASAAAARTADDGLHRLSRRWLHAAGQRSRIHARRRGRLHAAAYRHVRPVATARNWRRTWPPDEYICDGGGSPQTVVRSDFTVEGLKPEETIGHFDTIDGRTIVKPTNKVCIYAPRFAAVRKVDTPFGGNQIEGANKIALGQHVHQADETNLAETAMQPVEPVGRDRGSTRHRLGPPAAADRPVRPRQVRHGARSREALRRFLLHSLGRDARRREADPRSADSSGHPVDRRSGLQVTLNGRRATPIISDGACGRGLRSRCAESSAACKSARSPRPTMPSLARRSISRSASITSAIKRWGTSRSSTISPRGSSTCPAPNAPRSRPNSRRKPNEVGSLVLRWEIRTALAPGQGGVIRFQCKVR